MTSNVVSVDEDTPISAVAGRLRRRGIKRVPVLRHGSIHRDRESGELNGGTRQLALTASPGAAPCRRAIGV